MRRDPQETYAIEDLKHLDRCGVAPDGDGVDLNAAAAFVSGIHPEQRREVYRELESLLAPARKDKVNAALNDLFFMGTYAPTEREKAVKVTADLIEHLYTEGLT